MDGPIVFKKRSGKAQPRKAVARARSESESDSGSGGEDGVRSIKRRKTGGISGTSTAAQRPKSHVEGTTKYAADTTAAIKVTQDATKQSNWYDEGAADALSAQKLLGKTRAPAAGAGAAGGAAGGKEGSEGAAPDGTYKGQKNYSSFIQKNPDAPNRVGPVKAPTNVRIVTQIDYAPDVCKDYKQTGFCGFGDSCKFLHAREDYAAGWKLDKEWEINSKGKKAGGTTVASANRSGGAAAAGGEDAEKEEEENKLLEKIPFACVICKKPYTQPIVTNCGHYFCEKCALQRFRKSPSCAICGAGTGGRFNEAKNLKKLLDKKRDRIRKKKEKMREEGEEVSDGDEDKD
ncbi:uncharacterized protein K452DRAFT_287850 [Aplosporella prunicola CBS 121167]|uniref:Pre-mRNA-splicing factor CWC24 n=1 Tax=Aplosporella prunicola CBS 121167 TaxID=1176127 RepID=A0A6A6BCL5_9PEZI|nr:uncharacterized protein K452DRAFT_287850 [Aplosporella prunicola CBS 121167]KAF2141880.1 hypothetical protein K452DRAFT_287850 [Aplosporella prunicola CBS 121167]